MKKQISVFALAAASVVIGMSSAHAQLPATQFDPADYIGGAGADTITVGGTIPEYLQFTTVENNIDLGDIGGPTHIGRAISTSGRKSAGNTTAPFTQNTTATGPGAAKIEFQANTYVQIYFSGNNLRNVGPDGVSGNGDDRVLPTYYRVAPKGKIQFADTSGNLGGIFNGPGPNGQNPTNPGAYPSYSDEVAAANTTNLHMTYSPGGPVSDGNNGTAPTNTPSGLLVMAEADRDGLNDYKGAYNTTIGLVYYKY